MKGRAGDEEEAGLDGIDVAEFVGNAAIEISGLIRVQFPHPVPIGDFQRPRLHKKTNC